MATDVGPLLIWMGASVVLSERWKDPGVLSRAGRTEGRQVAAGWCFLGREK